MKFFLIISVFLFINFVLLLLPKLMPNYIKPSQTVFWLIWTNSLFIFSMVLPHQTSYIFPNAKSAVNVFKIFKNATTGDDTEGKGNSPDKPGTKNTSTTPKPSAPPTSSEPSAPPKSDTQSATPKPPATTKSSATPEPPATQAKSNDKKSSKSPENNVVIVNKPSKDKSKKTNKSNESKSVIVVENIKAWYELYPSYCNFIKCMAFPQSMYRIVCTGMN